MQAYAHQDIPFEQLVDQLNIGRNLSHTPLYQVVLCMDTNERDNLSVGGLSFDMIDSGPVYAKTDLWLDAKVSDEGVELHWTYDTDLSKAASIERFQRHFCTLLDAVINHPAQQLVLLPMQSEAEIKGRIINRHFFNCFRKGRQHPTDP